MLFAIDIGNTNMVIGCIDGDKILFSERLSTDHSPLTTARPRLNTPSPSRMFWIFTTSTAPGSRERSLPL